jgi:hypothetical protein
MVCKYICLEPSDTHIIFRHASTEEATAHHFYLHNSKCWPTDSSMTLLNILRPAHSRLQLQNTQPVQLFARFKISYSCILTNLLPWKSGNCSSVLVIHFSVSNFVLQTKQDLASKDRCHSKWTHPIMTLASFP